MRVLHIISSTSNSNGAMNVIMNYYRMVVKFGIQFDFVYFEKSELNYDEEINKNGGHIYSCEGKNKIDVILKIRSFIKKNKNQYDLVENHELYLTKFLSVPKNKLILHSHTTKYSQRIIASMRNYVLCHNIDKYANTFFSPSLKSANVFWPKKIDSSNFYIIRNAISYNKCKFTDEGRKSVRKHYDVENNDILLGYVARFDDGKNQDFLIDIMNELCKKHKNYKLLLVGDGKRVEIVKQKVKDCDMENKVFFSGQIEFNKIKDYLSAMDLFLFPSENEGLGQVAIEAQGNGLKCIASTGIPDEAKISDGFVFLPLYCSGKKNIQEWCDSIYSLSTERQQVDFETSGYDIEIESKKMNDIYKGIKGKGI